MHSYYRGFLAPTWPLVLVALCLSSCQTAVGPPPTEPAATGPPDRANRTPAQLEVGVENELLGFGSLLFGEPGGSGAQTVELFHAMLTTEDDRGNVIPRLAAALPSLDDGTWRVNSDGTMETIYKLRSGLAWHDGAPFIAQDLEFAHEARVQESISPRSSVIGPRIQSVRALDPLRVQVTWSGPHWRGGALREELIPLPSHLLGPAAARSEESDLPYWTTGFVGLGPYRLLRFRPGQIELGAFEGYLHGRPSIERITLRGYGNPASLQAAVVQQQVDLAIAPSWGASTALELRVAWASQGGGEVLVSPRDTTFAVFRRDGLANPSAFQQPPLRRALAAGLNRQQTGFTESLGLLPPPGSWVTPSNIRGERDGPAMQDGFAYDPTRAFRLLEDAGWRRDAEGRLRGSDGEPLTFELTSVEADPMQQTVARYWSELGVLMNLTQAPRGAGRPPGNWPGVLLLPVPAGLDEAVMLLGSQPAFSPPRFGARSDEVASRLRTALRPSERLSVERELASAVADEQPIIPLGFRPVVHAVGRGVEGPRPRSGAQVRPWITFNAHEWQIAGVR